MDLLDSSVKYLKGVGERRAALLAKLGIVTVRDLLYAFPFRYEDWGSTTAIADLVIGQTQCVRVNVAYRPSEVRTAGGTLLTKATVTDGTGYLRLLFFNNAYIYKDLLDEETEFLFFGKVEPDREGHLSMTGPRMLKAAGNACLHPVYHAVKGVTSRQIESVVKTALEKCGDAVGDPLGEETRKSYHLPDLGDALRAMHFPTDEADLAAARRRLIYDELLVLQLGILKEGQKTHGVNAPAIADAALEPFWARLPFSPTGAQRRAVAECLRDMAGGGRSMRRLLQGDVGSGKTAVAAALIACAAKSGYQSVLMAPTEVLATQHYATFCRFFEGTDVTVRLLTGSTRARERREILASLASGETSLLIGTHAVITPDVTFHDLALAVTDEQHRFGVGQRGALSAKGRAPHVLVMSATPIPRTLSLIVYGDLAISVLDEKPKGRQAIDTYAVPSSFHPRIYAFLKKHLDMGRQAYIVCPLAEEKPDEDELETASRLSAEAYMKELSAGVFKDYKTALLHGKMKPKEKDAIMADFVRGDTQLLICTVVIEVGIDVPNANVIVIENAECFGLSQLHQLRGRVGRGDAKSYCVLISDAEGETAKERFAIMTETNDGFQIAEKDLEMRGPGDFFGARQSGLPDLRLANLMTDSRVLYTAQRDAKAILAADPDLTDPRHVALAAAVKRLFAEIS